MSSGFDLCPPFGAASRVVAGACLPYPRAKHAGRMVGCHKESDAEETLVLAGNLISADSHIANGIDAVIVNGALLRHHNKDAIDPRGTLSGKLLRNGRAVA